MSLQQVIKRAFSYKYLVDRANNKSPYFLQKNALDYLALIITFILASMKIQILIAFLCLTLFNQLPAANFSSNTHHNEPSHASVRSDKAKKHAIASSKRLHKHKRHSLKQAFKLHQSTQAQDREGVALLIEILLPLVILLAALILGILFNLLWLWLSASILLLLYILIIAVVIYSFAHFTGS